jgi:DNA-binding transcriptional ArsR family regulator
MPTLEETPLATARVAPSAPLELMWVMHSVEANHEHEGAFALLEPQRRRLGPELTRVRNDGMPQYSTELVVLAHRSGTLLDRDLSRFFARIEDSIADPSKIPSLVSESPEELLVVHARLEKLRTDPEHRKQYVELLHELWSSVEDEWERDGRPAVVAEARRWTQALEEGEAYRQLLHAPQLWPARPDLDAVADAAAAEGKLILTPCWFGGKMHVIELDGAMYAGRGIRHPERSYKKVAAEISGSIKALADPTRLAILLRLARDPASVTEIARQFGLSQPTVSAHVQVLREAGLIEEKTAGRSSRLSASEDGLRRLFANAEESLVRMFRS